MQPQSTLSLPLSLIESSDDVRDDLFAVSQINAVPTLLDILCKSSGLGLAGVARVTDTSWTACAVKDTVGYGLTPGTQLDVATTLCIESKKSNAPLIIDHASVDPQYCHHPRTKGGNVESYVAFPIVLPNGRYFGSLFAMDPAPAKASDPKVQGMFKAFADVIASQLESNLQHESSRKELLDERAANELRDQFIAILGHDLRNPLQAIYATGDLMERKLKTDAPLAAMAARIKTNVKRMSSMIDDVLDLARGRLGGGIGVNFAQIEDINTGLQAVVKEHQDGQPNRLIIANISVTRTVRCDIGRVQQVASNLIGNALTHGAPTSPVKVTALADDKDLIFEVWNAGEPIPPENIEKIFEPFWRPSTTTSREGLGLGLHICSQIVRAHGGQLSVASTRETGTRFTARLPLSLASLPYSRPPRN